MNLKRMIFRAALLTGAVALLSLAGCGLPGDQGTRFDNASRDISVTIPGGKDYVDAIDSSDNMFYHFWLASGGTVNMYINTGTAGNYKTSWTNCNNFTAGKGWQTGTADRVITYSGTFNGGSNGYLAVYGWMESPLVEYYILDTWGNWDPRTDARLTDKKATVDSDGGTYQIYTATQTDAPNITGTNQNFTQYWSIRTSKRTIPATGTGTNTVTVAKHFEAWKNLGLTIGTFAKRDYQIVETEGYNSSGSSNITVGSGSGGGEGFLGLGGKYVAGGSYYMWNGEKRYPATPDGNKVLDGLFVGMLFHSVSGNSVDIELMMLPLDATTDAQIRAEKDPDPSVYAGMSPSEASGARATFWGYNASTLAVSAYRGWEDVTDGGMTITLPSFSFGNPPVTVNNLVMTYRHISDDPGPGVPYSVIEYDYTYTVSGKNMIAEGTIFVAKNPSSIPQTSAMILQNYASPAALPKIGNGTVNLTLTDEWTAYTVLSGQYNGVVQFQFTNPNPPKVRQVKVFVTDPVSGKKKIYDFKAPDSNPYYWGWGGEIKFPKANKWYVVTIQKVVSNNVSFNLRAW
jgi:hypothetical protein